MPDLDINKIINVIIIKKILQCKITLTYRLQKMNLLSLEATQQLSRSVLWQRTLFDLSHTLRLLTLMLKQQLTNWNLLCKNMNNFDYICRNMIQVKLALVLIKYSNHWRNVLQDSHITSKHVHMIPSGNNMIHLCIQQKDPLVVQFKYTTLSTAKTNQISVLQFNGFQI